MNHSQDKYYCPIQSIQSATFHNKQYPSVVNDSLGLTSSQGVQSIAHSTDDSPMGRTETS